MFSLQKNNIKTLVYIGANLGYSLGIIAEQYDRVYAFEPYPEIFNGLISRLGHMNNITFVNAACADEVGKHNFYVYPNLVSSSLAPIAEGVPTDNLYEIIEVPTINLFDYLSDIGVTYIDTYISDCQGSDLTVLKTLKPYINNRAIGEIMCETHNDKLNLYSGLDNRFQGFKDLLDENYKIDCLRLGRLDSLEINESQLPADEYEWDTIWSLKHD